MIELSLHLTHGFEFHVCFLACSKFLQNKLSGNSELTSKEAKFPQCLPFHQDAFAAPCCHSEGKSNAEFIFCKSTEFMRELKQNLLSSLCEILAVVDPGRALLLTYQG